MPDVSVAKSRDLLVRIDPGPQDIAALTEMVRIDNESLNGDEHLNELIPEPPSSPG